MKMKREPRERELEDDYPTYAGYLYVADGKVIEAVTERTVGDLKRRHKANRITICDIDARYLWHRAL
jgi:hypothetical protein